MSISSVGLLILLLIAAVLVLIPIGIALVIASVRRGDNDLTTNPNMAPCPDCRNLISIHAAACPHCGRPMKIG